MHCPSLLELHRRARRHAGWPWTKGCAPLPDRMEDGREWPRISVVTPSYNQARYIEETIRSVLLQGYPNLEYFVVDGGSTDGSVDVIRRYERWITWWVSERDRGQSHAINKGFARATGGVFAWLNSDDYYLPGALEALARAIARSEGYSALVGMGAIVDSQGSVTRRVGHRPLDVEHVLKWDEHCVFQPSCFFSSEQFRKVGGLDQELRYAMDIDLWLRLLRRAPFGLVDATLAAAREHPAAKTLTEGSSMFVEVCLVQIRHGGEAAARQRITDLYDKFDKLSRKVGPFVENPLYRAVRPLLAGLLGWLPKDGRARSRR